MKKILIMMAAVGIVGLGSCALSSCGGASTPRTENDSLAYALGTDIGYALKQLDSTVNINTFAAAMKDVMNNKGKMSREEAGQFIQEFLMVRKPAKAMEASQKFLDNVAKDSKVQKTETGLLYEVVNPGSALKAVNDFDTVKVVYHGTTKDGVVFDSSKERGDTVSFPLNRVIPGWTEGMKLVGEGGTIKLWIPSELAYGSYGSGNIGANEAIMFDVDLVQVLPGVDPAAEEGVK